MTGWLQELPPVGQALVAGIGTWALTAAGAAWALAGRSVSQRMLDAMLGFAAGIMLAASFWSLLAPSIEIAGARGGIPWMPALVGLLAGGLFLRLADALLPHLHPGLARSEAEGPTTTWRRATLLVLAITLHNIPEGLAVGVGFAGAGAAEALTGGVSTFESAVALAIGIGIQNVPEGLAVALPLRREGSTRLRAFWYGQLSAVVEPVAAVLGAWAVVLVSAALPYALAFAAGAMIYVVVEELIPEAQAAGNEDLAAFATLLGFALMMVLDVALG
ncbi:MAG: ZIP family metal transporter [Gemmatimonadetes bacterium]|nr:ZIP family metal transporter [Gemmatimonadota bacterium]